MPHLTAAVGLLQCYYYAYGYHDVHISVLHGVSLKIDTIGTVTFCPYYMKFMHFKS